jgi:hypothetical protein
MSGGTE